MNIKTESIVIRRKNFSEADRLVTLYTKEFGKITAIAKGIRRPSSRKSGHLEPGTWCKIFLAKGKNLDIITEVESSRSFGIENFSEKKAHKIFHLLELVDNLTATNQKNTEVFTLALKFLEDVEKEEDFALMAIVFKLRLLKSLGFFSSSNIGETQAKNVLKILEEKEIPELKKLNFKSSSYLKLLAFLDSIIEQVGEKKLKTSRFLNG